MEKQQASALAGQLFESQGLEILHLQALYQGIDLYKIGHQHLEPQEISETLRKNIYLIIPSII
jgi:hypothetical protein